MEERTVTEMYEELVKQLRGVSRYTAGTVTDLCKQAADAIEELQRQIDAWVEPERKALIKSLPKWIPVTERLPEKRKWVLCRCEANITEVLRYENNEWYHDPRHVYYFDFVTHWMQLPEPPKEET